MTGRILVIVIVVSALIAGVAMWWLQVHAFYDRIGPQGTVAVVGGDGAAREVDLYSPQPGRLNVLEGGRAGFEDVVAFLDNLLGALDA